MNDINTEELFAEQLKQHDLFEDDMPVKARIFLQRLQDFKRDHEATIEDEYHQALEKPYCGCEFCFEPFGAPPLQLQLFKSYGVYIREQNYGGPEEGGWYFDSYMLLDADLVTSLPIIDGRVSMIHEMSATTTLWNTVAHRHPYLSRDVLCIKSETSYRPQLQYISPQHRPYYC